MRVDRRARAAERLVGPDLVEVPVRVEQRRHASAGQLGELLLHGLGLRGGAAVDDDFARVRREHEDVGAGAGEHREPRRDASCGEGVRRVREAKRSAESRGRKAAREAAQHAAAIDVVARA